MKGLFNVMSRPSTGCLFVACNIMWYVLHTANVVAYKYPTRGHPRLSSYFSGQTYVLYLNDLVNYF